MIGKKISHYSITEKLGEGGMGEVYLAEDTRLHRKVALKFLPKHLTSDREARERFEREARAAAALNHPNIVTVYDIGEAGGQVFMAMELVEGGTLADHMCERHGGPMKIGEVAGIARQLAEGLARAHEAGIVHRDIKPSNTMVGRDGRVKILDFGLAKLKGAADLTKDSSTLGTVRYMSPEQARGEKVDGRSDIWSLGAVIYEMLTGKQPFRGEYDQHVIYSILNDEPVTPASLRQDIPPELERVVMRSLEKDPSARYENMEGVISDLERNAGTDPAPGKRNIVKRAFYILASALLVILAALLVMTKTGDKPARRAEPVLRQITFTGRAVEPAISPDGAYLAYRTGRLGQNAIIVKDIESGSRVKVLDNYITYNIHWSPDGSKLLCCAFLDENEYGVYMIPRLGGSYRKLLALPWYHISWDPEGEKIAFSRIGSGEISILSLESGDRAAVDLEQDVGEIEDLHWSPSGDDIMVMGEEREIMSLWVIRPDGRGQRRLLTVDRSMGSFIGNPRWSGDGEAVYFLRTRLRGQFISDLMKADYDVDSRRLEGDPYPVLAGLASVFGGPGIDVAYSISSDSRRLVIERNQPRMDLWMMRKEAGGEVPEWTTIRLTSSTMLKTRPRISPDGKDITFGMGNEESFDIYTMALPLSAEEDPADPVRLTYIESFSDVPAYSPDGSEIAFYASDNGVMRVWHMGSEGGTPKPYTDTRASIMAQELEWAPGDRIIYRSGGLSNFKVYDPVDGEESDLLAEGLNGYVFGPCCSRSGDRIAFFMNRVDGGTQEMRMWWVSPGGEDPEPVTDSTVWPVSWAPGDSAMYTLYHSEGERWDASGHSIFRMSLSDVSFENHLDLPFRLYSGEDLTMTPDGNIVVMLKREYISDIWLYEDFDPEIE